MIRVVSTTALPKQASPPPCGIIDHAVWLCFRFVFSLRAVEERQYERGVVVLHEAIRQWCDGLGQT